MRHLLTFWFVCAAANLMFVFNPTVRLLQRLGWMDGRNGLYFGITFGVSLGLAAGFGGYLAQLPWPKSRSQYKQWLWITSGAIVGAGTVSGIGFWRRLSNYGMSMFPFWWGHPAGHFALAVAILCVLIGYAWTVRSANDRHRMTIEDPSPVR
jgi:hypothetical protein